MGSQGRGALGRAGVVEHAAVEETADLDPSSQGQLLRSRRDVSGRGAEVMSATRTDRHAFLDPGSADRTGTTPGPSDKPEDPQNPIGEEPQEHDDGDADRRTNGRPRLTALQLAPGKPGAVFGCPRDSCDDPDEEQHVDDDDEPGKRSPLRHPAAPCLASWGDCRAARPCGQAPGDQSVRCCSGPLANVCGPEQLAHAAPRLEVREARAGLELSVLPRSGADPPCVLPPQLGESPVRLRRQDAKL